MKTGELMEIALEAGNILLVSGAEVYRVEDTILRILKSYNVDGDCFVLLSGIFITIRDSENYNISTVIKRIKGHTGDLKKIELVNSFSRWIESETPEYSAALKVLKSIESAGYYRFNVRCIAAGFTAFVYILLLGGSIPEALASFSISLFIYITKSFLAKLNLFQFIEFFVSGFIAGISALFVSLFIHIELYRLITGSIMILVPGMAITNGIKDALYGDIVSSIYRLGEALFISVAVGGGVVISLAMGSKLI